MEGVKGTAKSSLPIYEVIFNFASSLGGNSIYTFFIYSLFAVVAFFTYQSETLFAILEECIMGNVCVKIPFYSLLWYFSFSRGSRSPTNTKSHLT